MNTIEMRLQNLEVTNRRYKTIVIVMLGAVLVTTFMAFRSPIAVPDVLQAKKFEVVDDNGNVLVRVSQDAGNGLVKTYNKDGKKLVNITSISSILQFSIIMLNRNSKVQECPSLCSG